MSDWNNKVYVLEQVRTAGIVLTNASSELKGDKEVVLAAVKQYGGALVHASSELQGDKELVLAAVNQDGWALKHASDELKGDKEVVLAAVKQDGKALYNASSELQGDKEVVLVAVKQYGGALVYASEELKGDKEVVLAAVKQNGVALRYANDQIFCDDDFLPFAIKIIMDNESGKKALHKMVEDPKKKDALHKLVKFDPSIAEIEDERGRQAIDVAHLECKKAMEKALVLATVKQDGKALYNASKEFKGDKELVLAAVKLNGRALEYASKELKGDKEVVLAAVKQYGWALEYASDELKGDKEVVLAAVKQDGKALYNASKELKGDKEVVLVAVKQYGGALVYASEELKGDKEVVLAAVKQNGVALRYANDQIFCDDDFLPFAIKIIMDNESGKKALHKMVEDPKKKDALHKLVKFDPSIAKIEDERGSQAIDRACKECRKAMEKALRVFGRFHFEKYPRLHTSKTACVLKAKSYDKDDKETRVALKAMKKFDQVLAELHGRKGLDSKYVISILAVYVDASVKEDEKKSIIEGAENCGAHTPTEANVKETIKRILSNSQDQATDRSNTKVNKHEGSNDGTSDEDFPFIVVLDLGERDLSDAINHDNITDGSRPHIVQAIMVDIAYALHHLHENDRIHADLKPLNAVRVGSSWKLIDMDVSCAIGEGFGTKIPSTGFCPPEMAKVLLDATTDNKTRNIDTSKLKEYKANIAYDLWSFGVLLYHLVKGVHLWKSTNHNGDVNDEELRKLCELTSEQLSKKQLLLKKDFQTVRAFTVHDLLGKLLDPNPTTRVQNFNGSMEMVLEHPYFESGDVNRKTNQERDDSIKSIENSTKRLENSNNRIENELKALKAMTEENLLEIRLTRSVLLKGIFEATVVKIPTTFVILTEELPDNDLEKQMMSFEVNEDGSGFTASGEIVEMAKERFDNGMKWVNRMLELSSGIGTGDTKKVFGPVGAWFKELIREEKMYFYLIDEVTGDPVRGDGYPIPITRPSKIVPKLLPMMQVGMRAMSLYNGAAGIARMFGAPVPKVPKDWRIGAQNSIELLKQESSVEKFGAIHKTVMTGKNEQNTLRGHSLRELERFLKKYDPENKFADLDRRYSNNGMAIWTTVKDENMLEKIKERTDDRKTEENIHDDFMRANIKALTNQGATAIHSSWHWGWC